MDVKMAATMGKTI
ncbi:hypothetical protein KGM_205487A, partial [Danaus plexippus plexippus]